MYNYEVLKYVMLEKHYTSDIDIYDKDYKLAEKHMYYFYNTLKNMQEFIKNHKGDKEGEKVEDSILTSIKEKFIEVMDDDFNTSAAIANLHIIFKNINNLMKTAKKDNIQQASNTIAYVLEELKEVYGLLGFFKQNPEDFIKEIQEKYLKEINISKEYIEEEINKRLEAKKNKNFDLADEIRSNLDSKGIILNDTYQGTTWDIKSLYQN